MDLSVFFAGTGGSVPTARRGLPALLVRRGGERILFDCGEGTQRQLVSSVGLADLDEIFLTHYHADHWLGLPGLLKTFDLRARERPLAVRGPRGLRELLGPVLRAAGRTRYELLLEELEPGQTLVRDGYRIAAVSVAHRGRAFGYVLFEDERPGEFDPQAAIRLGLTPGPEFGRVQRGETIRGVSPVQVMGSARAGRKVVLSGDTTPCEALRIAAFQADLLVHEATFAQEEAQRAAETGHSTAPQAAALAGEAQVRMLALVHLSTRYPTGRVRDEARALFPETVLPRDFDQIEIPFPERGRPELVRWDPSRPLGDHAPDAGGADCAEAGAHTAGAGGPELAAPADRESIGVRGEQKTTRSGPEPLAVGRACA
jgi:ribonuclease Z